ncbi:sulfotransferase family 2 domain-containing protein [Pseudoalteromonas sp. C8]|uniref:sulfotransferase family 2 domain-containing protein n=1 Tax=Pseudoalteromonas sp. C8 TaxID=2686345 RepID=UPI0013FD3D1E|nr:sulfotransferase family 2 domain-containing protein [Pseudoalteromonas sp. C8]
MQNTRLDPVSVSKGYTTIIWSNESLFVSYERLRHVLERLNSDFELETVTFIRRHDKWIKSAYLQWGIKHKSYLGEVKSFKEWSKKGVNFSEHMQLWAGFNGARCHFINFDSCVDASQAMFELLGLKNNISTIRINEAPSQLEIAMYALYNSLFTEQVLPRELGVLLKKHKVGSLNTPDINLKGLFPTAEELNSVLVNSKKDLDAVNLLMRDQGGEPFNNEVSNIKSDAPNITNEKIIAILLHIVNEQEKSIESLNNAIISNNAVVKAKKSNKSGFLYTDSSINNLNNNAKHQFCMDYAMQVYDSDTIYSFIPKNGCSTLRLSVAMANGCVSSIEQGNWIHTNNQTFKPTLKEAATAQYKFVVLRCPFRRLASVFLDKFVAKELDAWQYRDLLKREVKLDDLTFEQFVESLAVPPMKGANIHWKPQNQFLLYKEYDDYFSLEHFDKAIVTLKEKIDFNVVDARSLTGHGTDKYEMLNDDNYSQTTAFDIAVLKRGGKCPSHKALYTEELVQLVKKLYADDLALYSKHCDENDLLFS